MESDAITNMDLAAYFFIHFHYNIGEDMRKIISISLVFVSLQAFAVDSQFELCTDTASGKSAFEIEKLAAIAEARYKIGNAKRIIEKAGLKRK